MVLPFLATLAVFAAGAAAAAPGSLASRHNMQQPPLEFDGEIPHFSEMAAASVGSGTLESLHSAAAAAAVRGSAVFQQTLDHTDPSAGTFGQRYWWSTEYWKGPGSPVVFFTPGEAAAAGYTGYLTNRTITGQIAQAVGGAVVMMEHRYWGESSPFANLTAKTLRYHTLANAIADTTNFARNVALPFDRPANGSTPYYSNSTSSNAPHAPWIFSGGSYSGALSAWVHHVEPGTFWAHHASSAVVQSIGDFWTYFEPVRMGMPANCSADVQRVVKYVDHVLETGSDEEIHALKEKFGLSSIEHSDDFAGAIQGGPGLWQSHDVNTGYSGFYLFCDYVENAVTGEFPNATTPGPDGVGLEKALNGYAKWVSELMLPHSCENTGYFTGLLNTDCYDTHNASNPYYTDTSVNNAVDRQWTWLLCNEPFMYWQDAAPAGKPSLLPKLVSYDYYQRQCALYFPEDDGYTFGSAQGKTVDDVNAYTGGWFAVNTTRLIWANGQFDPWRDATVSADTRPGGPLVSTEQAPVNVMPDGIHCSDLIYTNGVANAGVRAVIESEVATIAKWVKEFYA